MKVAVQNKLVSETKAVESMGYVLDPNWKPSVKYIIIEADGSTDGMEYSTRREALNELMNTEFRDVLEGAYQDWLDSLWDHNNVRFSEEGLLDYLVNEGERVANEMGYKIERVIKGVKS